mmetsp:Transcript_24681/g.37498  ORF Transcript_24681/g.37498 Transcript_24681/m.37498 type:complete len:393 (+) Transcript_24681:143-1321(+)
MKLAEEKGSFVCVSSLCLSSLFFFAIIRGAQVEPSSSWMRRRGLSEGTALDPKTIVFKQEVQQVKLKSMSHSGDVVKTTNYNEIMKSLRPQNAPLGPINLSTLPKETYEQFGEYNFAKPVMQGEVPGASITMAQIPPQAGPFMKFIDSDRGFEGKWSKDLLNALMNADKKGEDISPPHYPNAAFEICTGLKLLNEAMESKHDEEATLKVLVAGSISPWVESLVLNSDLNLHNGKVHVTDYNPLEIEDPRIEFVSMEDLKASARSPGFDAIISFSSIEHDGLGRYGDPVNPQGDIAAMAEYHSMLKDHGVMVLGVPCNCINSQGYVEANYHRDYNMARLNVMFCGFDNTLGDGMARINPPNWDGKCDISWQYQPVFIYEKTKSIDCYLDALGA